MKTKIHLRVMDIDIICNFYIFSIQKSIVPIHAYHTTNNIIITTEITCPTPMPVSHGSFNCPSKTHHKEGSTCTLVCEKGYKPSNNTTTITCQSSSTWTHSASCEGEKQYILLYNSFSNANVNILKFFTAMIICLCNMV